MERRRDNDNYPTPAALAIVGWGVAHRYVAARAELRVCEPACGDDQPFLRAAAADPRVECLYGQDLRWVHHEPWTVPRDGVARTLAAGTDWRAADFDRAGPWNVIITNPPFLLTEEFARASFARLSPGGVLVLLTRLSFLASQRRRAFWRDHPPAEVAVLRPRPSFTGDGKTDSAEYCFIAWCRDARETRLTWADWERA